MPAQAGIKDGCPPKKWLFYRYWLDILLLITSISDKLCNGVNINDLEHPKQEALCFFAIFSAATPILRVNCAEMAEDRPGLKFL